jgi:exosortase A
MGRTARVGPRRRRASSITIPVADVTTGTGWRTPPARPQDGSLASGRHGRATKSSYSLTVVFALWLAVAVIYWPSTLALNGIWLGASGDAYTHGYLVLFSSLWLTWRDRERLEATPVRPVVWPWGAVIVLSAAWLWSWRAAIQVLHVLLLPAILLTALVAVLGWRAARRSLFPVGVLLFAMPIWDPLHHPLQTASAKITEVLVWISGMPAYVRGDLIRLPGGTIEIAQACAGLNAVVIGLTVGALYGEIMRDPLRRRLLWLSLMGLLALAGNGVRIFIVTVAAYETDMRSSLVAHHIWLGWVLFAIAVGIFLLIAGRLGDVWDRGCPLSARAAAAAEKPRLDAPQASIGSRGARLAIGLACLGFLPALSYAMDFLQSQRPSGVVIAWPDAPQGWRGPMPDMMTEWSPRFENPTAESLRVYLDSRAKPVEVFAVAYRSQTQDGKLLGYRNDLLGSRKQLQARAQGVVSSPEGYWRETIAVDPTGARSVIWWRYRIGRRSFIDPRLSQAWYGLKALTGSPPVSSLTALRAPCSADCSAARRQLEAVAARLQPMMGLRPKVEPEG